MELESREMAMIARLEATAVSFEKTLGWLEERQRLLAGEVERISATVETSRREEELAGRLAEAERELAELKCAANVDAAAAGSAAVTPIAKTLQPLRRTLPSSTVEMLGKQGVGEGVVDVKTLDAALSGLSLEQRIAVKSQLRRAGAM